MKDKFALFIICLLLFSFNTFLIFKNPDCPFHVDYVEYTRAINNFYEKKIIEGNVNGKYLYTYLMAIFLVPFKLLRINLYDGMVFITGLFQILLVYLFYKYTKSLLKTLLMATTLTFLTFLGHVETVILASVFLILYFIFRKVPYSEFFITIASFIRLDFAVYYLFSRKKTAILPIAITFFQWLNGRQFIHSDFGLNKYPLTALILIFILSYGSYFILFYFARPKERKLDCIVHILIILFLIFFIRFPSQKVFFFPVILSFMIYQFDFKKFKKIIPLVIIVLITFNCIVAVAVQINRANLCTPNAFYQYTENYNSSIFLGIFQPYLNYKNKFMKEPYSYQITTNCENSTEYFFAEDWRNPMLRFLPYKFCLGDGLLS